MMTILCSHCGKNPGIIPSNLFEDKILCSNCYQTEEEVYLTVIDHLELIQIFIAGNIEKWALYEEILDKILEDPESHIRPINAIPGYKHLSKMNPELAAAVVRTLFKYSSVYRKLAEND